MMNDDLGDVGDFEKPEVPEHIINALAGLIINTGQEANEQVIDDMENLIEAMDNPQYMEDLAMMLRMNSEMIVDALLQSPVLREMLITKIGMYRDFISGIDFNDDGNM